MGTAQAWIEQWQGRIAEDYPTLPPDWHRSLAQWLVGENPEHLDHVDEERRKIAWNSAEFCYNILRQRYLNVSPDKAYRRLIRRLGNLVLLRNKIRTWVALSRDRHRSAIDVVQEIVQEMLNSDRYLQRQISWIATCTADRRLRNTLILTSVEEYCLRPIRNQPLLVYRFVNYLRRSQRGGVTQVPTKDAIRLVSAEVSNTESDDEVNLIDTQVLDRYDDEREWQELQLLRQTVETEFSQYLTDKVGDTAAQWLTLYLKGFTQDEIAAQLDIPIGQIYRLREKVSYHAIRVFTLKESPELVASWLRTSLHDHRLGLTPSQWQAFYDSLNNFQQDLLNQLLTGGSSEDIAQIMGLKASQILAEWNKLYLQAQKIRNSTY